MQVGTTKDQGLYNKPSAAVHPGALAAGTLPQYNIMLVKGHRSNPIQRSCRVYAASDNESCVLASYLNFSYLFQLRQTDNSIPVYFQFFT